LSYTRFIARRYLFAKKSQQAINIISGISVVGITFCVAAMIIILSAINGLEGLVEEIYGSFDADIRITSAEGKTFDARTVSKEKLKNISGVEMMSETVEEICILKSGDQWVHAVMKGVDEEYLKMSLNDSLLISGRADLGGENHAYIISGKGVADRLNLYNMTPGMLKIYAPVRSRKFTPTTRMFEEGFFDVAGIFSVNPEYDYKYIILRKELAQQMMEYGTHITAIEISLSENADPVQIKNTITELLGSGFQVKTKYEQNELMYQVNQSEKWFAFSMLVFVLVLAAFNIMASLTMLIIDKKNDVMILKSMGATSSDIRNIFFFEGFFINLFGGILGILIGVGVTFLQMKFHLVGMEGTIIDYYPVVFMWKDLIFVLAALLVVGSISAWLPVRFLVKKFAGGMIRSE
jgi:lipoprotein-releasing system permease protein